MANVYRPAAWMLALALLGLAADRSVLFRDDFSGQLKPGWQWMDPKGDCSSTLDAHAGFLRISVPQGTRHDLWSGADNFSAPRLTREVDGDFILETKLTSPARAEGGLLVWKDYRNNVRFERSDHFKNELFFAAHVNGEYIERALDYVEGDPIWLRLERSGSTYRPFYSVDGAAWHPLTRNFTIRRKPPAGQEVTTEWLETLKEPDFAFQPVTGSVDMTASGPLQVGLSVISNGSGSRTNDYDYFEIRGK